MSRVSWKIPFIAPFLLSKTFIDNMIQKKPRIWNRNSIISQAFVDKKFRVFNGKDFITINVTSDMIGHKFGEFAITKFFGYRISKKKKKH